MKYSTIVADPPWPIRFSSGGKLRRNGRGEWHRNNAKGLPYATMSVDEIAALPVSNLAESDAHLYLWITDGLLLEGVGAHVVREWGFQRPRLLIWRKACFGLGAFPRPQHEALVIARRGKLNFKPRDVGSVQDWPMVFGPAGRSVARVHSAKPDAALDLIERASPGPYLEMFARRARFGWDYWGDEALQTVEMSA